MTYPFKIINHSQFGYLVDFFIFWRNFSCFGKWTMSANISSELKIRELLFIVKKILVIS